MRAPTMISGSAQLRAHSRRIISGLIVAGVAGAAVLTTCDLAAAAGPFDGLAGKWAGTGVVTYSDGTKERLQCSVKYEQADPNSITQAVSCTSDSYNFRINAFYK